MDQADLDEGLDTPEELEAFRATVALGAGSIPRLPSGMEYVEDLRRADAGREAELQRPC
jgi:hypothetical protein